MSVQTASWQDFATLTGRMASGEQALCRKFWRRLKREAATLLFVEELLTAHYWAFDRHTPLYVKGILVNAIVYFVVPDRVEFDEETSRATTANFGNRPPTT